MNADGTFLPFGFFDAFWFSHDAGMNAFDGMRDCRELSLFCDAGMNADDGIPAGMGISVPCGAGMKADEGILDCVCTPEPHVIFSPVSCVACKFAWEIAFDVFLIANFLSLPIFAAPPMMKLRHNNATMIIVSTWVMYVLDE